MLAGEQVAPPTLDDVLAETRQVYEGQPVPGEDLMAFKTGADVTVHRHTA
jgi:ribonuclease Z